jgi:hypothetical protein
MGKGDPLVLKLNKVFGDSDFYGLDLDGFLGGIITRFNKNITIFNSFSICLGIYIVVHSHILGY